MIPAFLRCFFGSHGATRRETDQDFRRLVCTECGRTVAAMRRSDVKPCGYQTMKAKPKADVVTFRKRA